MADFSAKDVQTLRQKASVGMLDAKRALEESKGDLEAAMQWLRVKGLAKASARDDRENSQGAVAAVRDGDNGAIVELRCETDFVAKSPEFVSLCDDLAALVAEKGEHAVAERQGEIDRLRTSLQENIALGRVLRFVAGPNQLIDTYIHQQAGRGVNAVAVVLEGGTQALAHEIAVHIAFTKPPYLRREDVPADQVAQERTTVTEISRNEGKPEAALEKVVEGRMGGWFKERCLLEQAYVKDEKRTITDLLGAAKVLAFGQVVIGG